MTASLDPNTPAVEYFYDGKGLEGSVAPRVGTVNPIFAKGKLTKVTSSISETRYTNFDQFGRLTQMEQRTPVNGETLANATARVSSYQYNFAGALVKETYPSLREVNNEFEADGDLSRIYGKANPNSTERTYANGFSYTADGKIQRLKLGNNRWESAKFNDRLQLTELALGTSDGDGSLWKLGYEYGELENGTVNTAKNTGNIAKQTLSFTGLTNPLVQTFKYDSLYRLTEAKETSGTDRTWEERFGYDRYGNRTGLEKFSGASTTPLPLDNKTHPTINPATNRFNMGQGYTYDKNGNLIDDPEGRTFIFNGENKQRYVVKNGQNVGEYFYDGEGNRVKKKVYDANGVTIKEETIFVYSAGKLVEEYSTKTPPQNPTTSYTVTDQLLSPRIITDSNGNVVSRRDFMPFGEEITNNIGERAAESLKYGVADGIRQKFTGYQKDDETGLDFAEARMYENRHGRFTAVDPLLASGKSSDPQSFNRYVYVRNSPLILTDPSGEVPGDYYSRNGEYIGSDDKPDDKKIYYADVERREDNIIYVTNVDEILFRPNRQAINFFGGDSGYDSRGFSTPLAFTCPSLLLLRRVPPPRVVNNYRLPPVGVPFSNSLARRSPPNGWSRTGQVMFNPNVPARMPVWGEHLNSRWSPTEQALSFSTFPTFKRKTGRYQEYDWHHVVEQNPFNTASFGKRRLNSIGNLIPVERETHHIISGFYSSYQNFSRINGQQVKVREWLRNQSFEQQQRFGIEVLQRFGVIPCIEQ